MKVAPVRSPTSGLAGVTGDNGVDNVRPSFGCHAPDNARIGNVTRFLVAIDWVRLPGERNGARVVTIAKAQAVKSTRAWEMGRALWSKCLVALITTALIAGYGMVSPDPAAAEASYPNSLSLSSENGQSAYSVQLDSYRDSAANPRFQTDTETLDEGAPPAPPTTQSSTGDDVETLDQGAPPPSGATAPLVETAPPVGSVAGTYVAPPPATTSSPAYAAPVENTVSGPVIPPGFGTGHVHVAAGHP